METADGFGMGFSPFKSFFQHPGSVGKIKLKRNYYEK
jgi:hypothetical protein